MTKPNSVLLMTFGSAQTAHEVPDNMRGVRFWGDPDPEVVGQEDTLVAPVQFLARGVP